MLTTEEAGGDVRGDEREAAREETVGGEREACGEREEREGRKDPWEKRRFCKDLGDHHPKSHPKPDTMNRPPIVTEPDASCLKAIHSKAEAGFNYHESRRPIPPLCSTSPKRGP